MLQLYNHLDQDFASSDHDFTFLLYPSQRRISADAEVFDFGHKHSHLLFVSEIGALTLY